MEKSQDKTLIIVLVLAVVVGFIFLTCAGIGGFLFYSNNNGGTTEAVRPAKPADDAPVSDSEDGEGDEASSGEEANKFDPFTDLPAVATPSTANNELYIGKLNDKVVFVHQHTSPYIQTPTVYELSATEPNTYRDNGGDYFLVKDMRLVLTEESTFDVYSGIIWDGKSQTAYLTILSPDEVLPQFGSIDNLIIEVDMKTSQSRNLLSFEVKQTTAKSGPYVINKLLNGYLVLELMPCYGCEPPSNYQPTFTLLSIQNKKAVDLEVGVELDSISINANKTVATYKVAGIVKTKPLNE